MHIVELLNSQFYQVVNEVLASYKWMCISQDGLAYAAVTKDPQISVV